MLSSSLLSISLALAFVTPVWLPTREGEVSGGSEFAKAIAFGALVFFLRGFYDVSYPFPELRQFFGVCAYRGVVQLRYGVASSYGKVEYSS